MAGSSSSQDLGLQDVAADDGQCRGGVGGLRLFNQTLPQRAIRPSSSTPRPKCHSAGSASRGTSMHRHDIAADFVMIGLDHLLQAGRLRQSTRSSARSTAKGSSAERDWRAHHTAWPKPKGLLLAGIGNLARIQQLRLEAFDVPTVLHAYCGSPRFCCQFPGYDRSGPRWPTCRGRSRR